MNDLDMLDALKEVLSTSIKPLKLKRGSHADVGTTGQGCFMNVIAYLNGEAQITDESECVCPVVRSIAIWLNDYLKDDERQLLIPYIERAMGSKTDDKDEVTRRVKLVVEFADKCAESAESAEYAAKYAAESAKYAAKYAGGRKQLIDAAFDFLNEALPTTVPHAPAVIERAKDLVLIKGEIV